MSLLSIASNASAWRGYECYEGKRVLSWEQTGEHEFNGEFAGSGNEPYHVIFELCSDEMVEVKKSEPYNPFGVLTKPFYFTVIEAVHTVASDIGITLMRTN
jgi:hypothetical protein